MTVRQALFNMLLCGLLWLMVVGGIFLFMRAMQ
jgi:hypothetical protein